MSAIKPLSPVTRRHRDLALRESRVAERAAALRRREIAKDGERRRCGQIIAIAAANIRARRGNATIDVELAALETLAAHFGYRVVRRAGTK